MESVIMDDNHHSIDSRAETESGTGKTDHASKSTLKKWAPLVILVAAIAAAFASGLHKYFSLGVIAENRTALTAFVADNWLAAIALFGAIYVASTALSLPGGTILTIVGGFLFGWLAGGLVVIVAATIGASLVFLVAKSSVGEVLARKAGPFVKKLSAGFNEDAASYMLFLRLVPVFPFWLVNIAPALFNVRLRTFVVTTLFGIVPGTVAIALLGSGLGSIIDKQQSVYDACVAANGPANCRFDINVGALLTPQLVAGLVALGVVALIPIVIKRLKARKSTTRGQA